MLPEWKHLLEAVPDSDVDTFKIVARQATHTILDACRSEQQKSNINSSSSVCSHTEHTPQFQKSTLMPNCCRQCFYVFVKNVVNSIMLDKVGWAWSMLGVLSVTLLVVKQPLSKIINLGYLAAQPAALKIFCWRLRMAIV